MHGSSGLLDADLLKRQAGEFFERNGWSRERLLAYQRERLAEALRHAVAASPYYRETIGEPTEVRARVERGVRASLAKVEAAPSRIEVTVVEAIERATAAVKERLVALKKPGA